MTATAAPAKPATTADLPADMTAAIAAMCRTPGESAVVFIYEGEGVSYCVASTPTAVSVATDASTTPPEENEPDRLLAVAVISRDGTVTDCPIAA